LSLVRMMVSISVFIINSLSFGLKFVYLLRVAVIGILILS